jgi:hypothetical protein
MIAFHEHLEMLTADVECSHQLSLPFGSVVKFYERMLVANAKPTVDDVLFKLDLPVLDGVPPKDLMKLRNDERDSFIEFRAALAVAARECIALSGSQNAHTIAMQLQADTIEPALSRIRNRLAATEGAFVKKAAFGSALGALTTVCGVLFRFPAPIAASAGVAAVVTAANSALQKRADERREISLDDMYFLWKATEHAH